MTEVMINRTSSGHFYSIVRGDFLIAETD